MIRQFQVGNIREVLKNKKDLKLVEIAFLQDQLAVNDKGELILDEHGDLIVTSKNLVDVHYIDRVTNAKGMVFRYSNDGKGYSKPMTLKKVIKRIFKNFKHMKDPRPDDVLCLYDDGLEEPKEEIKEEESK